MRQHFRRSVSLRPLHKPTALRAEANGELRCDAGLAALSTCLVAALRGLIVKAESCAPPYNVRGIADVAISRSPFKVEQTTP
jgi:hypothetical protein